MSDKYPGGLIQVGAPAGFSVAFNGSTDYLTIGKTLAQKVVDKGAKGLLERAEKMALSEVF